MSGTACLTSRRELYWDVECPPPPPPRETIAVVARDSSRTGISGVVINQNTRQPLEYARVSLQPLGRDDTTGADGRFVIDSVAPGRWSLRVNRIGFELRRDSVQIADAHLEVIVPMDLSPLDGCPGFAPMKQRTIWQWRWPWSKEKK